MKGCRLGRKEGQSARLSYSWSFTQVFIITALNITKIVQMNTVWSTDEDSPGKPLIFDRFGDQVQLQFTERLTLQSHPKLC